jgi:outer membrane protein assembly factor BamB
MAVATAVTATGALGSTAFARQEGSATPVGSVIQPGDVIPPELANAADTDWPVEGRTLAQDRSVKGSSISSDTVNSLDIAWTFEVDTMGSYGAFAANPTISGDLLYLQDTKSNVYALNRESGELAWSNRYDLDVPSGGPNGVSVGYGAVIYSTGNATVIAADKTTGKELWSIDLTGLEGEGICMAPLIYDNRVWVSNCPASTLEGDLAGRRGVIFCLDITDGHILWTFDTTTDNLWGNPTVNSGGGIWHPPAVDADGGVYYPVANVYPWVSQSGGPSGVSMEVNTDYANNVLKIDTETGGLIWHTNITGRDIFDLDNHLIALGTVKYDDGTSRELIFTSGKHGFVVALDPEAGAEFWRTPVGTHRNAERQSVAEGETLEVWPGTFGGVETPFAYHDGVVYTAVFEVPTTYDSKGVSGGLSFDGAKGKLAALDGATGSIIWQVDAPSGLLAAATGVNDLVFTGGLDGVVRAYHTADGSLVWSAQTAAGLNAPLAVSGDYVYVPSGGLLIPSDDTASPTPESKAQLIAYKLS